MECLGQGQCIASEGERSGVKDGYTDWTCSQVKGQGHDDLIKNKRDIKNEIKEMSSDMTMEERDPVSQTHSQDVKVDTKS